MMRCSLLLAAVVALFALHTEPAAAKKRCNAVSQQNGETYCLQSSDGGKNSTYPNSTVTVKTMGSIQVTTTKRRSSGTRVLTRYSNSTRQAHRWH